MDQNSLIAIGIFSIICVICIATIGLSLVKENKELRNKLSEKSKSIYEVWLSSLSNNLPLLRHDCKFSQNGAVEYARKIENENERLKKILENEEIKISGYGHVFNLKAERLKKTIEDTEKRRTEAYELIANVYEFEQTIMPAYGRYNAGAIDISELETELESSFKEYFRREKLIKNKANNQDVTINTNRNVK